MGPVVHAVVLGVDAVVLAVAAAGCALVVGALLLIAMLARRAERRRAALDRELTRSRDEVDALCRKVDDLSDEVVRARQAAERDREYVITSLGADAQADGLPAVRREIAARRPALGTVLEERLVAVLARRPGTSPIRARAVEATVRVVSVAHGVRRALSPDVLDRAAAEAHVARRRSRRDRRRYERQARRLVRAVSTAEQDQERDQDVA